MSSRDLGSTAQYAAGCVCAAAAGAFLATQSGINSTLGSVAGRSFASVVSFAVGLAALVLFFLVDVYGLGHKGPDRHSVAAAPWWSWTGGLLGAWYVAVVIIFARTLGAATLMAIFVTAQLSTAVALDALGWVGFRRRPLHWARVLGLLLLVCGVGLVTFFDGSTGKRGGAAAAAARPPPSLTSPRGGSEPETDSDPLLMGLRGSGGVTTASEDKPWGGVGILPAAQGEADKAKQAKGSGEKDAKASWEKDAKASGSARRSSTRALLSEGGGEGGSSGDGDVEMPGRGGRLRSLEAVPTG